MVVFLRAHGQGRHVYVLFLLILKSFFVWAWLIFAEFFRVRPTPELRECGRAVCYSEAHWAPQAAGPRSFCARVANARYTVTCTVTTQLSLYGSIRAICRGRAAAHRLYDWELQK